MADDQNEELDPRFQRHLDLAITTEEILGALNEHPSEPLVELFRVYAQQVLDYLDLALLDLQDSSNEDGRE